MLLRTSLSGGFGLLYLADLVYIFVRTALSSAAERALTKQHQKSPSETIKATSDKLPNSGLCGCFKRATPTGENKNAGYSSDQVGPDAFGAGRSVKL